MSVGGLSPLYPALQLPLHHSPSPFLLPLSKVDARVQQQSSYIADDSRSIQDSRSTALISRDNSSKKTDNAALKMSEDAASQKDFENYTSEINLNAFKQKMVT